MAKSKLNINQEMFCQLYAGGGEYFGNGVWCYILAYKLPTRLLRYSELSSSEQKQYDNAKVLASGLLTNINIQERCNELVDALIKDEIVDRELVKVIIQNDELSAKVSAIKEYNSVKKRTENNITKITLTIAKEIADRNETNSSTIKDSK